MGRTQYLGHFNGAIQKGHLEDALFAARQMTEEAPLNVHEALDLLLLVARRRDPRLRTACDLWWKKFEAEEHPACDKAIAKAALEGLKDRETLPRCELVLRDLLCWVRPYGPIEAPEPPTASRRRVREAVKGPSSK